MANCNWQQFENTCSLLGHMVNDLNSYTELRDDTSLVETSENLIDKLKILTVMQKDKAAILPESLVVLFQFIGAEINEKKSVIPSRYYCDFCNITTMSKDYWNSHIEEKHADFTLLNIFKNGEKYHSLCEECNLYLCGTGWKLDAYLNSSCHLALHCNKETRDSTDINKTMVTTVPEVLHERSFKDYHKLIRNVKNHWSVARWNGQSMEVCPSIKDAAKSFVFEFSIKKYLQSMCDWFVNMLDKPRIHCGLCKDSFDYLSTQHLWDHLREKKHLELSKAWRSDDTKCFMLCLSCHCVFIDYLNSLSDHVHSDERNIKNGLKLIAHDSTEYISCSEDRAIVGNSKEIFKGENIVKEKTVKVSESSELPSPSVLKLSVDDDKVCETECSKIDLINGVFTYLLDRYNNENFCRHCPTYYYCTKCHYGTSYTSYWRKHCNNYVTNHEDLKIHHCYLCGLIILIDVDNMHLLESDKHKNTDSILSNKVFEPGVFKANCKFHFEKLVRNNVDFVQKLNHCICRGNCAEMNVISDIRLNNPFVVFSFTILELKNKFDSYRLVAPKSMGNILNFHCLDCAAVMKIDYELNSVEEHIRENHSTACNHSKCKLNGFFFIGAFYCCACYTLFTFSCLKSSTNILNLKPLKSLCYHSKLLPSIGTLIDGYHSCKKAEYILYRLKDHLIESIFKFPFLRDTLFSSCNVCSVKFKNLNQLIHHVSLPIHANIYDSMLIYFCGRCKKICLIDENSKDIKFCLDCYDSWRLRCIYLDGKRKSSEETFLDLSGQIKVLPQVNLINYFSKGLNNSVVACPILTSCYKFYVITVNYPNEALSHIESCEIYRFDIPREVGSMLPNFKYLCLDTGALLKTNDSVISHLDREVHRKQDKPFFMRCFVCSLYLESCEITKLERHFTSIGHARNLNQINDSSFDDDIWLQTKLSDSCCKMFKSKDVLLSTVSNRLKESSRCYLNLTKSMTRIFDDILMVLSNRYPNAEPYVFGSVLTGFVKKDSDIDIFIALDGDYFKSENDPLVTNILGKLFTKNRRVFETKRTILKARVPLVKLWHRYFKLNIDLNCFNCTSVENSKLLRFYFDFDERCRWLATAIKEWGQLNYLMGVRFGFNNYMMYWMILFFLMRPTIGILPSVLFLRECNQKPPLVINGWNIRVCLVKDKIKKLFSSSAKSKSFTNIHLLKEFFRFYATLETEDLFLSPLTGNIERLEDLTFNLVYRTANDEPIDVKDLNVNSSLILMDPFILNFNMTRTIEEYEWHHFKYLCLKSFKLVESL